MKIVGSDYDDNQNPVEEDKVVTEAARTLYLFYLACLLGGERDDEAALEKERHFYSTEDTEFKSYVDG